MLISIGNCCSLQVITDSDNGDDSEDDSNEKSISTSGQKRQKQRKVIQFFFSSHMSTSFLLSLGICFRIATDGLER